MEISLVHLTWVHLSHPSQLTALLVAITPLEQATQGFLGERFPDGPGLVSMSPLLNRYKIRILRMMLYDFFWWNVMDDGVLPKVKERTRFSWSLWTVLVWVVKVLEYVLVRWEDLNWLCMLISTRKIIRANNIPLKPFILHSGFKRQEHQNRKVSKIQKYSEEDHSHTHTHDYCTIDLERWF